jgi:metallo-beta-lactamase class B
LALLVASAFGQRAQHPCKECTEWNEPQKPFRIFGNTYYVGPHGLSSILVTSPAGHILMDGALPESARQITANIQSLGFRIEDVKLILNSHVHFDHAGGIAELQRLSGAKVTASPWTAAVMIKGGVGRGDPQLGVIEGIAPIKNVHELHDGETFKVGDVAVTAHLTPGHTPGGTSWTWRSCENDVCHDMVYADSQTPVSAPGFHFGKSAAYPNAVGDFEESFAFLEKTPCDILLTTHPDISAFWDRVAGRTPATGPDPMVNPAACRDLAQQGREHLRKRLAEERANATLR